MRGIVALAVLVSLVAATTASAQVRPLAPGASPPALVGSSVAYTRPAGERTVVVRAAPLAGGAGTELGRATMPAGLGPVQGWLLAGGADGLALRVASLRGPRRLFAGPVTGPLRLFGTRVANGRQQGPAPDLWAGRGAAVTLERFGRPVRYRLVARSGDGRSRRIPLPPGADARVADVEGALVAVARKRGRRLASIAIVDLASGRVVRTIGAGALGPLIPEAVGLGPDGSVALAANDETTDTTVGYADPLASTLRVIHRGEAIDEVAPASGRVAVVAGAGNDRSFAGARVAVLTPRPGSEQASVGFRGPPAAILRGLAYDGTHASWATTSCQVVARVVPGASTPVLPVGPCIRTEVSFGTFAPALPRGARAYRLRVDCLATPGRSCRLRVRIRTARGRSIAAVAARVPRGRARLVRLPLRGAALRRARAVGDEVVYYTRVIDPDGRTRAELPF